MDDKQVKKYGLIAIALAIVFAVIVFIANGNVK
jgi:hypothetical protein